VPTRALVHRGDAPPEEIAIPCGGAAEPVPGVRVSAAGVPGLVVESSFRRLRVNGRPLRRRERRLLRPCEEARLGLLRIRAVQDDPPTAVQARALLLGALRGDVAALLPALEAVSGPLAGSRFALRDGVLGRGVGAAIRLDDPAVSRRHARLRLDGARVVVEDAGSRNGLWLGGKRVAGLRELRPGDELRAGRTVLALALAAPPAPPASPAPPAPSPASPGGRRRFLVVLLALAAAAAAIFAALAPP
jgi:hypothetical protein